MWDEITYLLPNFNGATVEVWKWIINLIPYFTEHVKSSPSGDYHSKAGNFTLKYISKLLPSIPLQSCIWAIGRVQMTFIETYRICMMQFAFHFVRPSGHPSMHPTTLLHYSDAIMSAMASKTTGAPIVSQIVCLKRRSKKTPKLCVIGLCEGNSPVTGEFPLQRASNAEKISNWWCHHDVRRMLTSSHWVTCCVRLLYLKTMFWFLYGEAKYITFL